MLRLRKLDPQGLRAYVEDLRPRFLVLRVRARGVHIRWAVPAWAVEEMLRFALRVLPLLPYLAAALPGRAAEPLRRYVVSGDRRHALRRLDAFFDARPFHLLALPPGEPFVSIDTNDVTIELTLVALGDRS